MEGAEPYPAGRGTLQFAACGVGPTGPNPAGGAPAGGAWAAAGAGGGGPADEDNKSAGKPVQSLENPAFPAGAIGLSGITQGILLGRM